MRRRRLESKPHRVLTSRVVITSVVMLVAATGVGIQQAGQAGLFGFDPAGEAVVTELKHAAAMDRPEPQKGVKLGKPKSVPIDKARDRAPLKGKRECGEANAAHEPLGVRKGSRICEPSSTRQSPELVDARPLVMAEGFKPAPEPIPDPSTSPSADPSADPSATPTDGASEGAESESGEDAESEGASSSPSEPGPAGTQPSPSDMGAEKEAPEPEDVVVKPAAFRPGSATVVSAAMPMVTEPTPGQYLSPNWTKLSPATMPAATSQASLVYDPVRKQFVLFGGRDGTVASNETWIWTGTDWVKRAPATSPPARYAASMAWDAVQQKVILFGGETSSSTRFADVWAWDGTSWTAQAPGGTAPSARSGAAMAFDPIRGGLVLFGGVNTAHLNDTWQLKNNTWTLVQAQGAAGAPAPRNGAGLAYSTSTSQLVLFGGGTGVCPTCTTYNDTFVLGTSATAWSKRTTSHTPPARGLAAMTYDPGIGAVVMFGGLSGDGTSTTFHNDTWAWTGTDWSQAVGIASPSGRAASAMASDSSGHTILFGGSGIARYAETWTYDSSLPVLDIEVSNASGGTTENPIFWVGDSAEITITAVNAGVTAITPESGTSITSALHETALAAGTEISWDDILLDPCTGTAGALCGDVSDLTTTISNISIPAGSTRVGDFVATLVGTQRGCELIDIPAITSSVTGGSNEVFSQITVCGGGLGLENWWTYDTTDLGSGGTASVNAANGNLVVKQYDTAPVQTRGRLAIGLGRAYNSQDLMSAGGPIGAGWQFDLGDTGETAGGMGIAGLKLPNLQSITQPLSMPYIDRDGTRHVFRLRSVGLAVGETSIPVDLTAGGAPAEGVLNLLNPATLPFTLTSTVEGLAYNNLCIDQAYSGPKGTNMFLFRYIGVGSSNACTNPASNTGGIDIGWSLVRPDRVRYDFNALGDLIRVTDPTGQQLIYTPGVTYGPTEIHTKACGKNGVCPKVSIDYNASGAPSGMRHVKVTDTAGRVTSYLVTTDALMPQLKQVWLPGNPLSSVASATPSIAYTYATGTTPCPGSAAGAVTVGQLCSVTDAQAGKTTFAYTKAPLGPDRILKVTDRRGNDTVNDGANKGLTSLYTWTDKTDGSPDYVTVDMAAPTTVTNCGSVCQRVRYSGIDAHGRVGEIAEGTSNDVYLRQSGYFWDGGAISSCSQPSTVVNHNLCQTIRRAAPSTTAFSPNTAGTAVVNGVTAHDEAIDYLYGELGQVLRKKVLLNAAQPWTDANSAITTYGTKDQYFDANGDQRAYNSHVEGNGVVESTGSGVNYATAIKRDGPVAYWRLGEPSGTTMTAAVGPNGNYANGATPGHAGAIRDDTAVSESTTGWGGTVSSLSGFANGSTPESSDFTIETWQKTVDTSGQEYAFSWGVTGSSGLVGRTYGGKPMISLTSGTGKQAMVYTTGSIADGNWHHVVYTYTGSGTAAGMKIWVDGVAVPITVHSDTLDGSIAPTPAAAFLFAAAVESHIDEVSLFSKVISSARIKAHYDAANGGKRVEADTLYAVTDQVQELSPRGNSSTLWGDYLTTIRRDVPTDGASASTFKSTDPDGICGAHDRGNTGVVCEADTPASNGTPAGTCISPLASPPAGSAAPPKSGNYAFSCTKYVYNTAGQRTTMHTAKANAEGAAGAYEYRYYDDADSCSGEARANCDLSGTVSSVAWLKAVIDPAGEKTVFAYDAAGNIARTWERNAAHGKDLAAVWSTAGAPPSKKFLDQVNSTPVTSDSLSVSNNAIMTVQPDGTAAGAGANGSGELGDGTTTARSKAVPAQGLTNVVKVSQSSTGAWALCSYTAFLTGAGDVWFAGSGLTPAVKVGGLKDIIDIHAAGCHVMALDNMGGLWVWGDNTNGQIGNGSTAYADAPVKVLDNVSQMHGGFRHSLAVKTDGTLWAWGHNASGALGLGDTNDRAIPTKVPALEGIRGLGAGLDSSYAIGRDGKVWAWGENQNGGLGLGDATNRTTPTRITTLGSSSAAGAVREIEGSAWGAAALMADGKIRAWGVNNVGQLGASGANSTTPIVVPGLTDQVALAGGWATYASADMAGKITVWGATANHQRADGTSPETSTPTTAGVDISPYRLPGWQLRGTRDATGNLTTTTYDRLDQPKRVRSGRGNDVLSSAYDRSVTYDAAGRPISSSGAQHRSSSAVSRVTYDPFGNPVKTIDARGVASLATFDAVNRQLTAQVTRGTATESPSSCSGTATAAAWTPGQDGHKICTTSTTWDGLDRQVTTTDADSQVTRYLRDAASRQTGVDTPRNADGYTTVKSRWLYDKDGNTRTACSPRQVDPAEPNSTTGCVVGGIYATDYVLDRAGRPLTATRHRATTNLVTTFGYDADGNTTSITDANDHTTTQTFDLQGRQLTRTVPRSSSKSFTSTWGYDYSGNVTSVRSPGSLNAGSGSGGDLVVDGTLGLNSTDGAAHGAGNPFKVPDGAQYRNVTLQNGAHLTAENANGLMFHASGTITVCSGCSITMAGKGYAGGAANQDAANPNPGNGGLKGAGGLIGTGSGGGGGAHKTDGDPGAGSNPGAGGLKAGKDDFSDVGTNYIRAAGGGGGSGGAGFLGSSAKGGNGGGYIRITANKVVVNGTGTVTAAGATGANGGANSGGAGGGAGGGIWIAANDIQLAATTSVSVAGGNGGTGANNHVGGNGSSGFIRFDADTVTNEPAGVVRGFAATVTAVSYDAANRPIDTVEGSQTTEADPALADPEFSGPDANGLANTRTRAFYNADGAVAATLPPTAFSDVASLTAPRTDTARRMDYDLDGRVAAVYAPRYDGSATSIGAGNDGGTGANQQTAQCSTGRTTDHVTELPDYGTSTGVCMTRSTYDPVGNIARQYLPTSSGADNRYLEYTYTGDRLPKITTGPNPTGSGRVAVSTARFDGTGQATWIQDALGNVDQSSYTGDDLVRETTGQSYTIDSITVTQKTTTAYDAAGNTKSVTNPMGHATTQTWTSDNLLAQIVAPGPATGATATTKYTYDNVGNPIEVRDPNAVHHGTKPVINEFTFDNLISATHTPITSTSHRSVQYSYSPAGMKVATETARCASADTSICVPGNSAWNSAGTMRLTYGANGRLADQIGRDKSSITTAYTQDGNPKRITDPTSSVTVTAGYYLDGRVRTVDDGSNANTYAYDASGQVTVRTDQTPAGGVTNGAKVTTSYAYNQASLPSTMDSEVLDQTTSYNYDAAGRVDRVVTGNHVNDWSWHPNNTLAGIRNEADSTSISEFVYRYDNNGNVKSQTVTGSGGSYTNAYEYAPGQQVTKWTRTPSGGTAAVTDYTYDRNNNRETVAAAGQTTTWKYNLDNSINEVTAGSQTKKFVYNNAGLLTSDGCSTTSYDDFDRVNKVETTLVQSQTAGCGKQQTTVYGYDGLDRQRSSAVTNAGAKNGTTRSVYDGLSSTLVGQKDAASGQNGFPEVLHQLDAGGVAVAYEQTGSTGHKAFLDTDGHGNVTTIINTGGSLSCAVAYEPFGGAVDAATGDSSNGMCKAGVHASTTGNSLWYRGQSRDGQTGNYQLGTRTYSPATGAFTAPDAYRVASPSTDLSVGTDPLTMNTYTYVNGNPINMWDPSGHRPDCVDEGTCNYGMRNGNMVVTAKTQTKEEPQPYLIHVTKDEDGRDRFALVQNQAYVNEFGWEQEEPEVIGTVCTSNATHTDTRGRSHSWGPRCITTGSAEVAAAVDDLQRSDKISEDVKDALTVVAGAAAYHEDAFAAAAAGVLDEAEARAVDNAIRGSKVAGKLIGALDIAVNAYNNLIDPSLSNGDKAFNILGYPAVSTAGGLAARGLLCAGTGGWGCAAIAFGGATGGGLVFDKFLAKEPEVSVKYRPPISQCRPAIYVDSSHPWDSDAGVVHCER